MVLLFCSGSGFGSLTVCLCGSPEHFLGRSDAKMFSLYNGKTIQYVGEQGEIGRARETEIIITEDSLL